MNQYTLDLWCISGFQTLIAIACMIWAEWHSGETYLGRLLAFLVCTGAIPVAVITGLLMLFNIPE